MSTIQANAILDASGGNTVTVNGVTPNSDVVKGRNLIINGDMTIDQRNSGSSITPTSWQYSVDRFRAEISQQSKLSFQQDAGSVTPPQGFSHYLGATTSSAYTPVTADYFYINTQIEGFDSSRLSWGTSDAKNVVLSFWVRSSLTGTHSGAFRNGGNTRSYPFTFTINAANTWEYKSLSIAGDTSGTWATNNTSGVQVSFSLGGGTTYRGTAGAWASADYRAGTTGSVDVVGTSGATFYITGVKLEVGTVATEFNHRPYTEELQLCHRYYYRLTRLNSSESLLAVGFWNDSTHAITHCQFPVTMRTLPTVGYSDLSHLQNLRAGVAWYTVTAMSQQAMLTHSRLYTTVGTSQTPGDGSELRFDTGAPSTCYLDFDAEL